MSKASEKAYREIREQLLRGTFKPGERLIEDDLASLCGVSRTPIREALRRLASDMFVRQIPNHGTFVIETSEHDVEDLFELRAMLEGYAAARAAHRVTADALARLNEEIARIDRALSMQGAYYLDTFLDANRSIHAIIIGLAGSERLRLMLHSLTEQSVVLGTLHRYSMEDLKRSNEHHKEIMAACGRGMRSGRRRS
ncbi:GntR family transcriptional regulator [Iodidimonas nitroreducens]|uniref:GntR family transcriptional regulator n=1 Tax=Iodidimonas nitroreducens TaxID=1236968 RepID=A0A5A7NBP1_9PROT|nr:GntR family transcriptional regulator [Iodidimonas nitroreducens]GER04376.1 GntR family transcriptional regulator [Iodidimonas nitroreducens]